MSGAVRRTPVSNGECRAAVGREDQVLCYYAHTEKFKRLEQRVVSECTVRMPSGWVVATHSPRNITHAQLFFSLARIIPWSVDSISSPRNNWGVWSQEKAVIQLSRVTINVIVVISQLLGDKNYVTCCSVIFAVTCRFRWISSEDGLEKTCSSH